MSQYIGLNTQWQQQQTQYGCCHQIPPTLTVQDANYEIIKEREELRIKIAQLEQNHLAELEVLKNNIIAECESTIEKELREQELVYENKISQLNCELKCQVSKSEQLEAQLSKIVKDNQQLRADNVKISEKAAKYYSRIQQLEAELIEKLNEQNILAKEKLQSSLKEQENVLQMLFNKERNVLLQQIEEYKQRINEFQIRMKSVYLELEKLQVELNNKNSQVGEYKMKYESLLKNQEMEAFKYQKEIEQLQSQIPSISYEYEIKELREKLFKKKEKLKLVKQKVIVNTETVIVEKPVEVEKIVEVVKYVPVEKIVKQIIPPKQPIVIQECVVQKEIESQKEEIVEINEKKIQELSLHIEKITKQYNELIESYNELEAEYNFTIQDRQNILSQINNYNLYIKQLELQYSHKNQELMDRIALIQAFLNKKNNDPNKIIIKVGSKGVPVVEKIA